MPVIIDCFMSCDPPMPFPIGREGIDCMCPGCIAPDAALAGECIGTAVCADAASASQSAVSGASCRK